MQPDAPVTNVNLVAVAAAVLNELNSVDPLYNANQVMRNELPRPSQAWYSPTENSRPDMLMMRWNSQTWIFFSGIRSVWQATEFVSGALQGPTNAENAVGVNLQIHSAVIQSISKLRLWGERLGDNYLFVGHSYGGAVAHLMHSMMLRFDPNCTCRSLSFGAPKYAQPRTRETAGGPDVARWFNSEDPVPYAMPNEREAPQIWWATSRAQRANLELFGNSSNGVRVDELLRVSDAADPGIPCPNPGLSLVGWLTGRNMMASQAHLIQTYAYRLRIIRANAIAAVPPALTTNQLPQVPSESTPVVPPNPPKAPTLSQSPPSVPQPGVPALPSIPTTGYRRRPDGKYIVYWFSQEVALVRTGKQAQRMARSLSRVNTSMKKALAADRSEISDAALQAADLSFEPQD